MTDMHQTYMRRCIELAQKGAGKVAPNPMVGAVLVHNNRIIGEGYHRQYGGPHAEVNCINDVQPDDQELLPYATLYVSLEPCAHFGKTPPCSDLIIRRKIPSVVIGCRDPFTEVDGKGIDKLVNAGVEVLTGILEPECKELNKRFFTFVTQKRPYIILKWAQTANGKIAGDTDERFFITNDYTNRLVHQWRSEEAAILVGTNTALKDDPALTNRLWVGNTPVRMVLDSNLRLPDTLQLFNQQQKTIVFNRLKHEENKNILYCLLNTRDDVISQILGITCQHNLQSILVEGGRQLLQSFIDAGIWDEARVLCSETVSTAGGTSAPLLGNTATKRIEKIATDTIYYYTHRSINESTNQ